MTALLLENSEKSLIGKYRINNESSMEQTVRQRQVQQATNEQPNSQACMGAGTDVNVHREKHVAPIPHRHLPTRSSLCIHMFATIRSLGHMLTAIHYER